jgi:glycosyltransferase involved in cell wall biosynthesis
MKIALVHYYLVSVRGGERVFHTLAQTFPEADLFAVVYNPASQPEWLAKRRMTTSFLQMVPGSWRYFRQSFMFYPFAVEQFDLSAYDVVISSSAGFTHGVITPPETCHVCYCHNTFRYAWNWYHEFMQQSSVTGRLVLAPLLNWIRTWDVGAAQRVDHFISNSLVTQQRIRKYYRRESTIIHPPIETARFATALPISPGDYYLTVSELVPYKKVDVIIEAFNHSQRKLVIVGDGPQRARLQALAKNNITFAGRVSEEQLIGLYQRCRALIFMAKEDFGMVPLEANAAGRPVIAYGAGGALETVAEGTSGVFFSEQTVESLADAIDRFEGMSFDSQSLRDHAAQFDVSNFQKLMRSFICEKVMEHQKVQ